VDQHSFPTVPAVSKDRGAAHQFSISRMGTNDHDAGLVS
jgi:hypothetical protein